MEQAATRKELRQFGLVVGTVFTVIGLWPLVFRGEPVRLWAIGLGASLILLGAILPQALTPIHKGWMWVGHILGWINTRILLGLVFRLLGKATMRQAFAESSTTYRVVRAPRPRSHMKHQF